MLPSTFIGGPRYIHEKQNDAMAYIRKFGCADLFITMTCNPKWTDITENLLPRQAANDRPDTISRFFKLKLRKLMDFIQKGIFDQGEDSYSKYRGRSEEDGGHVGKLKDSVIITNQWVVPYNPCLLHQFNCHINVEICSSIKSIKYVLKYVYKGTDQAVFQLQKAGTAQQEDHQQNNVDEISMFQNARYIGSIEAGWRLLGNDIHERFPMDNAMNRAHGPPPATTLSVFFQLCHEDPSAIELKYPEVPEQYTWQLTRKQWQKRKRGKAIGRMYTISPRQGECYFLRLLLNVVKGPKSYDDLKTVNGEVCATFREACPNQGLLEDDQHLQLAMEEACATQSPKLLTGSYQTLTMLAPKQETRNAVYPETLN
ncbi:hypothetical protein ACOMHN_013075 [Nucella lapillus]